MNQLSLRARLPLIGYRAPYLSLFNCGSLKKFENTFFQMANRINKNLFIKWIPPPLHFAKGFLKYVVFIKVKAIIPKQ